MLVACISSSEVWLLDKGERVLPFDQSARPDDKSSDFTNHGDLSPKTAKQKSEVFFFSGGLSVSPRANTEQRINDEAPNTEHAYHPPE